MNYHRNNNSGLVAKTVAAVGIVIVLSVIFAGFRNVFGGTFTYVGKAFWSAYDVAGEVISVPITLFRTKLSLEQELRVLQSRVSIAEQREALLRALQTENIELKAMAGGVELDSAQAPSLLAPPFAITRNPILAVVKSRPGISMYDTLIIDRGEESGVKIGNMVISAGGALLGEVDMVYRNSSRVVLMSYPGRKINVLIGANRLSAIVEGDGGGVFSVKVPDNVALKVGDLVETVENEPWVIGTVGSIQGLGDEALKKVYIKSPVNFQQMKWVVVIDKTYNI